jgi:aspartate/methionine/tyrosine aminotransferase
MDSLATRVAQIEPFHVMEVVKQADAMERAGRSVIHLSIGEPDFTATGPVQRAAAAAIAQANTQYTPALGLHPLRERIAEWYETRQGVVVDPAAIAVTAGASAALLLTCAALVERDTEVLLPDPSYPCNRHFIAAFDGRARLLPTGPDQRFQLDATQVERHWGADTRGVLIASPSNPTGTSIERSELRRLIAAVEARGGFVVSDEIYLGLSYDGIASTALSLSDRVVAINSFSKYFAMTGWRLGWVVMPSTMRSAFERLAQNLYICASTIAQHAALACFEPESIAIYEERRAEFRRRRDFLVPALDRLGFAIPVHPDGAFYVYADIGGFSDDSDRFVADVLQATGVCLVPGKDFGVHAPERYVRISYATSIEQLGEAVERLRIYLGR